MVSGPDRRVTLRAEPRRLIGRPRARTGSRSRTRRQERAGRRWRRPTAMRRSRMRAQGRTATTKRPLAIVAQAAPDAMSSSGIGRDRRNGADGGNGKRTRCKEAERDRHLAQDHDRISQNDRADTKRGDWTSRRDRDDGRNSDHHRWTDAPFGRARKPEAGREAREPQQLGEGADQSADEEPGLRIKKAGVIVLDERKLDLQDNRERAGSREEPCSGGQPGSPRRPPILPGDHPGRHEERQRQREGIDDVVGVEVPLLTEEAVGDRADADGKDRRR